MPSEPVKKTRSPGWSRSGRDPDGVRGVLLRRRVVRQRDAELRKHVRDKARAVEAGFRARASPLVRDAEVAASPWRRRVVPHGRREPAIDAEEGEGRGRGSRAVASEAACPSPRAAWRTDALPNATSRPRVSRACLSGQAAAAWARRRVLQRRRTPPRPLFRPRANRALAGGGARVAPSPGRPSRRT